MRSPYARWSRVLLASMLVVAGAACAPAPVELEWRIEATDPALLARASVVDARILRGGCDGPEVYGVVLRPSDGMGPVPPVLEPGRWSFAAEAHDASCVRFARSCETITLPGTTRVVNTLVAMGDSQVCTGVRCNDGSCRTADEDGDGVGVCVDGETPGSCDCDDDDATVRPGAADPCMDGVDQDCDDADDECDVDCDGFPAGRAGVVDGRDCDDSSVSVHPNGSPRDVWARADGDRIARGCEVMPTPSPATDTCRPGPSGEPMGDGIDQDCNGFFDDGSGCTDPRDRDRDGALACLASTVDCDTNDCDPGVAPSRAEICGNDVDEDGDGTAAPCDPADADHDGQRAMVMGGTDCDDSDPHTYAGAADDCRTPEAESCGAPVACTDQGGDADGDGFVARPLAGAGDCDDHDPEIRPFAPEDPCDGRDNDCDGVVDEVLRTYVPSPGVPDGCVRAGGGAVPVDFDATARSSEHCGGCGVATSASQDCCAGALTQVDTSGSCGDCGHDCGAHTRCDMTGSNEDGNLYGCACAPDGMGNWDDCDGTLATGGGNGCETDLDTDASSCGRCGHACREHQRCMGGTCVCDGAFLDCDGMESNGCEVDGSSDATHCGRCDQPCMLANATSACEMSSCVVTACTMDFADCDGVDSSGCETHLDAIPSCGRCGDDCATVQHATASCSAMLRCDYTSCDSSFGDCDTNRANGCETSLTTVTACGSCGANCNTLVANAMGRACTMGHCDYMTCASGFGDCDGNRTNGCERALNTTSACGACGNACGPGESCNASGDCACGATSAPTGSACGPSATCSGGMCVAA
ncbi:MAG: MopE-related protein [Sandaracinus sp.]